MKIGYARVSTIGQNLNRQLDLLQAQGCKRESNQEKISGTKVKRPELDRMLDALRAGDTLARPYITRLITLIVTVQNPMKCA